MARCYKHVDGPLNHDASSRNPLRPFDMGRQSGFHLSPGARQRSLGMNLDQLQVDDEVQRLVLGVFHLTPLSVLPGAAAHPRACTHA
jgi:hypothetical protein